MAKWEDVDLNKRVNGVDLVRHTIRIGSVDLILSRAIDPVFIGMWVMTCWPWALAMPLSAESRDVPGAKKEALEWLRGKLVEMVTQIKWSSG